MIATLLPEPLPAPETAPLTIDLLGPPRITLAGRLLSLPRRQLRAMLYRLAAATELVPRDQICYLFWPDMPEAAARRNLVVLLTHLRRALPLPDALLTQGDAVGLDGRLVTSDVAGLAGVLGAPAATRDELDRLAAAVERYRGPFLDGFALPGCDEYEAWLERERSAWERRYLDALLTLVEGRTAAGAYAAAIEAARRYLAVDETAEVMHRRLMALYAVSGDRAAALRQYARCVAVLDTDLGVAPQTETRTLFEAIRDGAGLRETATNERGKGHPEAAGQTKAAAIAVPALPVPANPLLGRADEMAQASAALTGDEVRLLTLCGPGGSGKTRLAIEVARRLQGRFRDGVVYAPLATVRDPAQVAGTLARACGVQERGTTAPDVLLREALRDKQALLVVDNCEHLAGVGPLLAGLLAGAPGLRVLTTSRVRLHLSGEHVLQVGPLPLPDLATLPLIEELAAQPAVALLLARARAVDPALRLTAANAADLAAICVRLDGLPLAIELAAARLKLLSPRALLQRLNARLVTLPAGPSDLPERQRTLRATIDWSYDLLDAGSRALFARLAVFAGGFTLDAAEAVCGEGCREETPVLDRLETLLDAHLLTRGTGADGEPRFSMLETIREYALERLGAEDGTGRALRAHALYFAALAEQSEVETRGAAAGLWLRRLDDERGNLLAAIGWTLDAGEAGTAVRMTGALERYWLTRGDLTEGQRLIERALALASATAVDAAARAQAHEAAAALAMSRGEFAVARDHGAAGVALRRGLGHPRDLAAALLSLSYQASMAGDRAGAAAAWQEGEALANELSDPELQMMVAKGKGREVRQAPDPREAHGWLTAALRAARRLGDPMLLAHRLLDLAPVTLASGDGAGARAQAEEALRLASELGHRVATAMTLNELGESARYQGEHAEAGRCYAESLRMWREMGNRSDVPRLLHNLAYVALAAGDVERAAALFRESLDTFRAAGIARGAGEGLAGLAAVATVLGWPLDAARLWGAAEVIRERGGWGIWPPDQREYERYLERARAAAASDEFRRAWEEGRRWGASDEAFERLPL